MIETDELIADLQRVAAELGRPPSMNEYNEHGNYSYFPYTDRFGSWTDARKAAGLEGGPTRNEKIPKEDLLEELHRLAEELGRTPSEDHMVEHGEYSKKPYRNRFGSWNAALEEAGLELNREDAERADLIADIQRVAEKLGHPPTIPEIDEHGAWGVSTYKRRWDGWADAIADAGLDETAVRQYDTPESELIEEILIVSEKVGRTPRMHDMDEVGRYSGVTYQKRFESWSTALERAGFDRYHQQPVETECAYCGSTLERQKSLYDSCERHFCTDKDCRARWLSVHNSGAGHPQYKHDADRVPYGDNYEEQRQKRLERDEYQCAICGMDRDQHLAEYGCDLHIHHITPRRVYHHDPDKDIEDANKIENLLTLCAPHHKEWEGIPLRPHT